MRLQGLLAMLDSDYEDLHGMGMEYLMQFFDKYLKRVELYEIGEDDALRMFYESSTGVSFADDETGLYGQSPDYIFGLFLQERNTGEQP